MMSEQVTLCLSETRHTAQGETNLTAETFTSETRDVSWYHRLKPLGSAVFHPPCFLSVLARSGTTADGQEILDRNMRVP